MSYIFKRSKGEQIFQVINFIILTILTVITFYPVLYVAMASISEGGELMRHTGLLLSPAGDVSIASYKAVFKNPMILKGYLNTLTLVLVGVTLNIIMTSLGAYFFSRKNVALKNIIMFFIVFTMFFSGGMIPFYLTVKSLKITDTLWSLILPFLVSTYNLIIMKTSFQALPVSLEESAKLDGANDFTVLFRIIIPLSKPVIAVMVLYYGVGIWNGWFWASVFIRTRELLPLQVILREILLSNDTAGMTAGTSVGDVEGVSETIKYATIMVATLPILCVYPFLQKYFTKGVLIGAIKG